MPLTDLLDLAVYGPDEAHEAPRRGFHSLKNWARSHDAALDKPAPIERGAAHMIRGFLEWGDNNGKSEQWRAVGRSMISLFASSTLGRLSADELTRLLQHHCDGAVVNTGEARVLTAREVTAIAGDENVEKRCRAWLLAQKPGFRTMEKTVGEKILDERERTANNLEAAHAALMLLAAEGAYTRASTRGPAMYERAASQAP